MDVTAFGGFRLNKTGSGTTPMGPWGLNQTNPPELERSLAFLLRDLSNPLASRQFWE
jgi:hypothetical protein